MSRATSTNSAPTGPSGAVIFTGAGDNFSVGADISEFAAVREDAAQSAEYENAVDISDRSDRFDAEADHGRGRGLLPRRRLPSGDGLRFPLRRARRLVRHSGGEAFHRLWRCEHAAAFGAGRPDRRPSASSIPRRGSMPTRRAHRLVDETGADALALATTFAADFARRRRSRSPARNTSSTGLIAGSGGLDVEAAHA